MEHYCGSTFWDTNITWNTTCPDFTECFENTALLWPVCGFLWIGVILDVYFRANLNEALSSPISLRNGMAVDIPSWPPGWTWLGILKIFNAVLLIIFQVGLLWGNLNKQRGLSDQMPDVYWTTPIVLIVTHLLSISLVVFHKARCVHTSGLQLIYWMLLFTLQGIMFRTKYRLYLKHADSSNLYVSPVEPFMLALFGASLTVMVFQTFLFCWSDIPKSHSGDHTRLLECTDSDDVKGEECPILRASFLSYILFSYATPLVLLGNKTTLTKADMWDVIPSMRSQFVSHFFTKHFGKPKFGEIRSIYQNMIKPLWNTCGWYFVIGATFRLTSLLLGFLAPKVMGYLIDFVEDGSIQEWKGYMWAALLFGIYILVSIFLEQFLLHMFICYVNVGTCLNLAIYRKALQISHEARKDKTTGEIVNLMSVDTEKIRQLVYEADAIWATPIQLTVGIVLLWMELGVAVLPGIGVLCSIIPINWVLTSISVKYQRAQMTQKDQRIKLISEVLNGIQVIKLYAWESPFQSLIEKVRGREIGILRKRFIIISIIQFVFDSIPFLVSIAAFFTYIFMSDGVLDAKKAFTSVSLFALLTEPVTDLPRCIAASVDALVSFRRINSFLNAEEIEPKITKAAFGSLEDNNSPTIQIVNGNFAWEEPSTSNWKLTDINLEVKPRELVAVVGSVASGKSALLSAILGEMKMYSGQVKIDTGKVAYAYAPQIPWILNTTLRENVCFGKPYIKESYDRVIHACCLIPDIQILPAGDLTEIGEKGITLSGGQQQRVSIARMAYSGADIFIMDDIFSSVDSHVGSLIWDRLIGQGGLLATKTRVLCTHAYNFLSQVDTIIVLEEGRISSCGSYNELIAEGGKFSNLLSKQNQTSKNGNVEDEVSHHLSENTISTPKNGVIQEEDGKLIEAEELQIGQIKLPIFISYIRSMGYPLVVGVVLFFFFSEGLSTSRNLVLSKWTSQTGDNSTGRMSGSPNQLYYASAYALCGIAQSMFYLFGFFTLAIASLRGTKLLHNNMLRRILLAPMSFFNVTPLGRIVNRFSSDVESVDRSIPSMVGGWMCHVFKFFGILIAISYANVYFILFIIPLSLIYYFIQRYYITCMQQLQRIVSADKSPIYAHFHETLQGTSTIRAYRAQERFCGMLSEKIDSFIRGFFPHLIVRKWLSIRLGFLGAVVVFIPAVFAVVWRDTMDPSLVGLSISYAMQVVINLNYLVKATSFLQYNFVSVERILEYTGVEQEANFETPSGEPPLSPDWPQNGSINFREYETRYRLGLDLVLKNFSCQISPGEKIGIVGRTGAGKSSLTLALFRILEGSNGEIEIDGVNIARVGLHNLRRRMTVIPQAPLLFSSSLRVNLDPFGEYEDDRLWDALRLAHLSEFVEGLEEGLEYSIAEGGENLSVGQRQLVCLARAILRKSRILILDEATASLDSVTDELIQQTIRDHFKGCTILNVAHRLNTVLDSSRIMVLSQGEIVEFDSPQALLNNSSSHFYAMARDAGIIHSD